MLLVLLVLVQSNESELGVWVRTFTSIKPVRIGLVLNDNKTWNSLDPWNTLMSSVVAR